MPIVIILTLLGFISFAVYLAKKRTFQAIKNEITILSNEFKDAEKDHISYEDQLRIDDAIRKERDARTNVYVMGWITSAIAVVNIFALLVNMYTTVPAGHVKIATIFGEVKPTPYAEGLHFPVNPFYSFSTFDLRQKTHMENAGVPSEDKLITAMDVSVQYRTIGSMTPSILKNTGNTEDVIAVHLKPKLRSILREQGKGVKKAQDFFTEAVQLSLQTSLQEGLEKYLTPHGLQVDNVLIRDVVLPTVIRDSIEQTKKREQEVVKQRAELERFATEQEQKVKTAQSEYDAAKLEAQKIKTLADAEAYKIAQINKQLAASDNYIELKKTEQWNGQLPLYTGGDSTPLIDLRQKQ